MLIFLLKTIIRNKIYGPSNYFPNIPFHGTNPECFDVHGKFDYVGCPNNVIYNVLEGKGYYIPTKDDNSFYHIYSTFDEFFAKKKGAPEDSPYKHPFYYTPVFVNFTDTMSTLLFGNETTIGQICSYAKALDDNVVNTLPGYCCLDAPYEANLWGETVSTNGCKCLLFVH